MFSKIEMQKNTFGVCAKCNNFKSNFNWCPSCDCAQLIKNFNNWSSENDKLDEFIRYTQSTAKSYLSYLEWIPFERFENVNKIGSGELSDIYSANWKDGERIDNYWDDENNHIHERSQPIPVALKCHKYFQTTMKILTRHHRCTNNARHFIRHYGVTKNPGTGEFIIVMQYANDGSLKDFLRENKIKHDWQWKLNLFRYLAQDLSTIHNVGLVHQDVKNENVFIQDNWAYLSQLYWSASKEDLTEKEFTIRKAKDIYGFGILMIEIACERLVLIAYTEFFSKAYDIPKPILKLINNCICDDFIKRPDINKILYILEKWCGNPRYNQFNEDENFIYEDNDYNCSENISFDDTILELVV